MKVQLFKGGNPILGSDGVMYIDGRFGIERTKEAIKDRNERYDKIPHLKCDGFAHFIGGNIRNGTSKIIEL